MAEAAQDYQIDQALSDHAWRAHDAFGRSVVLKRLPDDCLQRGQLHPNVRLRLQRLRELPLASLVNIFGVERMDAGVMLVSEYVDGTPIDQVDAVQRGRLLKELRLALLSMHQLGMVHGAVKPGNVIVEPGGAIKLIDPSPLLHDDPALDLNAVEAMGPSAGGAVSPSSAPIEPDTASRQRPLIAAVALAVIALGAALAAALYLSDG